MRVENNNKAFAYRVPIGDYNYLQCVIAHLSRGAIRGWAGWEIVHQDFKVHNRKVGRNRNRLLFTHPEISCFLEQNISNWVELWILKSMTI